VNVLFWPEVDCQLMASANEEADVESDRAKVWINPTRTFQVVD
jgi:hypothetical protein